MKRVLTKLKRLFTRKIKNGLSFTVKDFNRGRNWAKRKVNPLNPNQSLWESIYCPHSGSEEIIHTLNKFINE